MGCYEPTFGGSLSLAPNAPPVITPPFDSFGGEGEGATIVTFFSSFFGSVLKTPVLFWEKLPIGVTTLCSMSTFSSGLVYFERPNVGTLTCGVLVAVGIMGFINDFDLILKYLY